LMSSQKICFIITMLCGSSAVFYVIGKVCKNLCKKYFICMYGEIFSNTIKLVRFLSKFRGLSHSLIKDINIMDHNYLVYIIVSLKRKRKTSLSLFYEPSPVWIYFLTSSHQALCIFGCKYLKCKNCTAHLGARFRHNVLRKSVKRRGRSSQEVEVCEEDTSLRFGIFLAAFTFSS